MSKQTPCTAPEGPWLSRTDAAKRLRVSPATVDRYARDGRLPRYETPGGAARYRAADVDALITRKQS